jgi:hypothetical protein
MRRVNVFIGECPQKRMWREDSIGEAGRLDVSPVKGRLQVACGVEASTTVPKAAA